MLGTYNSPGAVGVNLVLPDKLFFFAVSYSLEVALHDSGGDRLQPLGNLLY